VKKLNNIIFSSALYLKIIETDHILFNFILAIIYMQPNNNIVFAHRIAAILYFM